MLIGQTEVENRREVVGIESKRDLELVLGFADPTEGTITFPERVVKSLQGENRRKEDEKRRGGEKRRGKKKERRKGKERGEKITTRVANI